MKTSLPATVKISPTEGPPEDLGPLVAGAYLLARHKHRDQYRASGEPYFVHPVSVAEIVASFGFGEVVIAAALCHDVLEDTATSEEELQTVIGRAATNLVLGVTKLTEVAHATRAHVAAATLRRLLVAATDDPRVLVLKIADRMHNIQTLGALSPQRQKRIAVETLEVYAPLAHRLGMNDAAALLEDLSFRALAPGLYDDTLAHIHETSPKREETARALADHVKNLLDAAGIAAVTETRKKHVFSTYRKSLSGNGFDDIYDLVGIRVIVDSVEECYAANAAIVENTTNVPDRFRDYIAMPRYSTYQSLHSTLMFRQVPCELQVRTWEMHAAAEYGTAAHWRYKDQSGALNIKPSTGALPIAPNLPWISELLTRGVLREEQPSEYLRDMTRSLETERGPVPPLLVTA